VTAWLLIATLIIVLGTIVAAASAALEVLDERRMRRAQERELLRVSARASHIQFQLDQAAYTARQTMLQAAQRDQDRPNQ
jgi:chloramphenicol 3-O-phosphotransferase